MRGKAKTKAEKEKRSRRSRANKGKGRAGEHEWASLLRDAGWYAKRRLLSGAHVASGAGDVLVKHQRKGKKVGTFEVKRKQKLPKWLTAWADRKDGIGLAMRADGQSPWFVVVRAQSWLKRWNPERER